MTLLPIFYVPWETLGQYCRQKKMIGRRLLDKVLTEVISSNVIHFEKNLTRKLILQRILPK